MIKGAIFDLDGTLVDSMEYWNMAPSLYLESLGIKADADLAQKMFSMTVPDSSEYMRKRYGLNLSSKQIFDGIYKIMGKFYREDVQLKPNTVALLDVVKNRNIPMVVATVTDKEHVEAVLRKHKILDYFKGILTVSDVGAGKEKPDIFLKACDVLGTTPSETIVFEDAQYAIDTARKAGFYIAGVFEGAASQMCNLSMYSYSDFLLSLLGSVL